MRINHAIDTLRRRVDLLREERTPEKLAPEMGVDPSTLRNWLRQTDRATATTLLKIEAWCDRESDRTQGGTTLCPGP